MDGTVPDGSVLFLGDSITMALVTSAVSDDSVNYGIGYQRSDQLIESMSIYESINRARLVVVSIGTNDLLQNMEQGIDSRYRHIINLIPDDVPVFLNSVFPSNKVSLSRVVKVVESAKKVCSEFHNCTFINAFEAMSKNGHPTPGVLLEGGVHFTDKGYRIWIDLLSDRMKNIYSD